MSYLYVLLTILLTVYGQLVIKWQVLRAGPFPESGTEKLMFLLQLLANPWVISAFIAALVASVSWMAAMTRLPLSHAYPFMSLGFVLILIFSAVLFGEPLTLPKIAGITLVFAGLAIGSQG
jgi:multidrug transporter EmrE-like cation transporter